MTALDGIRVICLGQFYMAPYSTMLMARMGAEVIKVEAPGGDPYRHLPTADEDGVAVQFSMMNAGKRLVRLDLKTPEGRDVFLELVRRSDVLVQNLSPGAMERFDLSYETLRGHNPRLVMASGTGFGSFGPYAGEPAMDLTIQARSAVMSTTGHTAGPPTRTGPSVVDLMAATHILAGVLAAIVQRERTGRGQHVEVSLQDAILPSLSSNIAGLLSDPTLPERTGNRHGGLAVTPYNAYETNDGWITVLCPTQGHWERLCDVMDTEEARDPRLVDMAGRLTHIDLVDEVVSTWTRTRGKREIAALLKGAKVPSSPIVTLPELMEDPHFRARQILRTRADDRGDWHTWASPILMSDSPVVLPERAGRLGQDTDAILTGVVGLSEGEVADLRTSGVA